MADYSPPSHDNFYLSVTSLTFCYFIRGLRGVGKSKVKRERGKGKGEKGKGKRENINFSAVPLPQS
ncbi:hypothetical protein, partial [Aerosakkonema funiforme]|uniref:hypothetical protein n=1 Tax=Aerosakkonema funiforme TaxID=1246630 RepID=UPI001A7E3520